jgi:hypothetical protein
VKQAARAISCDAKTQARAPTFPSIVRTSRANVPSAPMNDGVCSQGVLDTLLKDESVATLSIRMSVNGDRVSLEINSDGLLRSDELMPLTVSRLAHRMAVLGGHGEFCHSGTPGTTFMAELSAVPAA